MPHLPFTARAGLLALAVAVAAGCASAPSQPARQAQEQPMVQLQDPDQTPREKWSDAMVILRGDMGIEGQRDIPREQLGNAQLLAAQGNARLRGGAIETGGVVSGAAGYAAPPTGLSASAALGAGLALGFLTAPPAPGPAQQEQIAAWVPAHLARNMEQAIEVATKAYKHARRQAFEKVSDMALPASRYPVGTSPTKMYPKFTDLLKESPVPPIGGPSDAPSFLPPGKYFGPIFFARHATQMRVDRTRNDLDREETMVKLSQALPEWFIMYSAGLPSLRGSAGSPPAVYKKGIPLYFIEK